MGPNHTAVALTILRQERSDAVSICRVAEGVGITPMAIYHHFPSREALNTITDREFPKLRSYMQAHPLNGHIEDPFLWSWQVTSITLLVNRASSTPFSRVLVRRRVNSRKIFGRAAEMKQGFLKKDDAWEVAFVLCHVHGYVMLYRTGRIALSEKDSRKPLYRPITRFLHGLKA
jgi:AcrR family transcriptional regulator